MYILIFLILCLFSATEILLFKGKKNKKINLIIIVLSAVFLGIFAGVRLNIGADWGGYLKYFEMSPLLKDIYSVGYSASVPYAIQHIEPGYILWTSFLKSFSNSFNFFLSVTAILVNFSFIYFFNKKTNLTFTPILLFYSYYFFDFNFLLIRQGIAVAIFLMLGFKYLEQKKIIKYTFIILLASTFHFSALMMWPMYFVFNFFYIIDLKKFTMFIFLMLFLKMTGIFTIIIEMFNLLSKYENDMFYYQNTSIGMGFFIKFIFIVLFLFLLENKSVKLNSDEKLMLNTFLWVFPLQVFASSMLILSGRLDKFIHCFWIYFIILFIKKIIWKESIVKSFLTIIIIFIYSISQITGFFEGHKSMNSDRLYPLIPYKTIFQNRGGI